MREGVKKEIKEREQCVYLLKIKAEQIKKQIEKVEEMVNFLRILTPEESIDPAKTDNVKVSMFVNINCVYIDTTYFCVAIKKCVYYMFLCTYFVLIYRKH